MDEDLEPEVTKSNHTVEHELARAQTPINKAVELDKWREGALCASIVAESPDLIDLWFSEETTTSAAIAADVCFRCPVREGCLEWASVAKQRAGIWGGLGAQIRLKHRQKPHNYEELVELPNPYMTENIKSKYHVSNLEPGGLGHNGEVL